MDLCLQQRVNNRPANLVASCSYRPSTFVSPARRFSRDPGRRSQTSQETVGNFCLFAAGTRTPAQASAPSADIPPAVALTEQLPILSGGGGGIFAFWQLGIIQFLEEHYDLTKLEVRGASAGALMATLAACEVDPRKALDLAHSLAVDAGLWDRKLKLAGVWGGLIRAWLYGLLPPNAADLVRGRLKLVVTDVRAGFKQSVIQDFANNKELVEANLASVHVPFFLDWRPFAWYRGRPYVDGSLADFASGKNSELLVCEGRAVILDYFMDDQLTYKRMDFLKLPSHEGAVELMGKGYRYAERAEATGEYRDKLGAASRQQSRVVKT